MKIAITADLHLVSKEEAFERYHALESIFRELSSKSVDTLIIAGDLFDRDFSNYSAFDWLCREFSDIRTLVIRGNHDFQIEQRFFSSPNIHIITSPVMMRFDSLYAFLVPFSFKNSLDEALVDYFYENPIPDDWILVGHGDYITSQRVLNPYERGLYMPLTKSSLDRFHPRRVFLGHIHRPSNYGRVIYPGSPCSVDITETGRRRFLIYDTESDSLEEIYLKSQKIYFAETLIITPYTEREEVLKLKLQDMISSWRIDANEIDRVILRLTLKGVTSDLNSVVNVIEETIKSYRLTLYGNQIDSSELKLLKEVEPERVYLLEMISETVEQMNFDGFHATKERVLEKAIEMVFK